MAAAVKLRNLTGALRRSVVKTPTLLQMEAVECGAAALGSVMAYHGLFIPLEQLRVTCGVSRDGSKASNLLKAARQLGFEAKGLKKDVPGARDLRPPFIVFWNFNHFVVVNGFRRRKVFINDPATGPRTISLEEFDLAFTGVVLVFEPTSSFKRGGQKRSTLRSLRSRLWGSRLVLLYAVLATLGLALPNLAAPLFSRIFVDDFLIDGKQNWLRPLLLAMTITILIKALLTQLQLKSLVGLETKLSVSASSKFLWHVLRLPMDFFAQRYAGEVASRVEANDRVAALLSEDLAMNLAGLSLIGFYFVLMLQYDVLLTIAGAAIAFINLFCLRLVSKSRRDRSLRLSQERGKLVGTSMSTLRMIETIKSTAGESDAFARWAGYQAKVVNAEQELGESSQMLSLLPPLLGNLNAVAILCIGGFRVMDGLLSMGMLVAFQSLMSGFIEPVNKLVDLGGQIQQVQADLDRLDDVLKYPEDRKLAEATVETSGKPAVARLEGHLEIKNISFGYSRLEPPSMEDFSLSIAPGQQVALVGDSGSGKSTVAKLVAGLYEPWSGEIYFDGKPREKYSRDLMAGSLSIIDQDIAIFEGTVRDNITMWEQTIDESEVIQAAKDAGLHELILSRPGGYDFKLEEGGRNLSGGQRQRVEIARALAKNPALLVMDEATSALDAQMEAQIADNLRRRGCTCLIVAHRLSTIRDCDQIVVLEKGRIVERGSHSKLIQTPGIYSRLIEMA